MSHNTSMESRKDPYLKSSFWVKSCNHFWLGHESKYTPIALERFNAIVRQAEAEMKYFESNDRNPIKNPYQ